ncbi:hypothetical protein [Paenibacillus methanolicus]|uniref:Uncharacterized protein n=1 Tax=Paenibacillus methanolicus TaxID=582686 RepID=A0A5S5CGH8_9BACL|nr:hypothetical protein [Paenibacillus methanolicus]TYP78886.1 hypothetical protein BCM02_1011 [Paenibacillus methanolicus]
MRIWFRRLERLLTLAAIYFLLVPAIVFASLVIGMTGETDIGQSMLVTLLLLLCVILLYRRTYARPSGRRAKTIVIDFTREDEDDPPPLSGIYWDLYEEQRELERLNGCFAKETPSDGSAIVDPPSAVTKGRQDAPPTRLHSHADRPKRSRA